MTPRRRAALAAAAAAAPARLHLLRRHGRRAGRGGRRRRRRPALDPDGRPVAPPSGPSPIPTGPVVALDFRLEDDLRTVTGTETVVFTPDRPTGRAGLPAGAQHPRLRGGGQPPGRRRRPRRRRRSGGYEPAGGGRSRRALRGRARRTSWRRGSPPRSSWTSRSRSGRPASTAWAPTRACPGGPAAPRCSPGSRASAGRGIPSSTCPARPPPAPSPTSPCGLGPRGAHGPDDRRPGRAVGARGRPPHLDVDGAGGPRRQRGGGRVHDAGADDARRGPRSPSACCPTATCPSTSSPTGRSQAITDLEARSGRSRTAR